MNYKNLLIVGVFLLAILTIGAVSASEDANLLTNDSNGIVGQENAADNVLSLDDEGEEISAEFDITGDIIPYNEPDTIVGNVAVNSIFDGSIGIYSEGNNFLMKNLDDFDLEDETKVWEDDQIHLGFTLGDVNNFKGLSEGDVITFMVVSQNVQIAYSAYTIHMEENGYVLTLADDGPDDWGDDDFEVIFFDANVADHDIALGIPINQNSSIVDNVAVFIIEVDFWGDIIRTEWDKDDVSMDEERYYWTTTELGIDDRMWDIAGNVDCEVTVIIIDEGDETEYYARSEVRFSNTPYISCGELSPFTESEPAITFSSFPDADDLFTISIRKDGDSFKNMTFKISEMEQYMEDEENYYLYLDDLGISELGEYEVSVIFTGLSETDEAVYTSTFNVVPFAIRTFTDIEQITSPVFAIALPEDSEGNVMIKVNGTQVFNENLSDIGYTLFFRGDGYYIKLNDLNLQNSGYYDVEITVNAMDATRTANNEIYVNVTENTFEFKDAIYMLEGFMDTYLGTPISDSEIVLYLNGKKAATGKIYFEGVSFEYEGGYADIYGCLLPGQYQARLEIGGVAVGEDTFEILDNSGNIDAYINEVNGEYYLNFKAPWPKCGHLWGYTLNVYVDAYHPDDMFYNDEPVISLCDDEFENLLDEEWHALDIGELEQGNHFIFVEYFIENDDISLEDKDYFIRIFDVVNKIPTDISAVYDGSDVVATLTNGATGQAIKNANVRFIINDVRYTVKSDASGKAKFSTAGLDAGTYTVTVSYEGNSKYSPSSASVDIVVKVDSVLSVDFNNGVREVVATLTNGATGQAIKNANVRFEVNGVKSTVKSDANGQAKVSVADLALGTYEATVYYLGNSKYNPSNITVDFTITKIMTSISIYYDESTQELVATLINSETGQAIKGATIVFNYNGVKTSAKSDKLGQARLHIGEPVVESASLSYGGNSKYLKSYASIKLVADKIPTVISNFYYKETQEVVATLINRETGQAIKGATVVFNFNGVKTALKTDKLGQVKLSVADLVPDEYYISSSYGGNFKYAGSVARISFVKI